MISILDKIKLRFVTLSGIVIAILRIDSYGDNDEDIPLGEAQSSSGIAVMYSIYHPNVYYSKCPLDSKVHGANVGPILGRQDPGGPYVGHMNFVIWVSSTRQFYLWIHEPRSGPALTFYLWTFASFVILTELTAA